MGDIFRGAVLTLFAQDGENADDGLSRLRDPGFIKPCKVDLRLTSKDQVSVLPVYISSERRCFPKACPLVQRGWVLQEEVLSPRGLHFGSDQATVLAPGVGPGDFGVLRCLLKFRDRSGAQQYKSDEIFRAWYSLIMVYCRRELTFATDVLAALAGLAMAVAKSHNIQYISGIWKEDIAHGILWSAKSETTPALISYQDPGPGPEFSKLPSWAWASQMGNELVFWTDTWNQPLQMCVTIDDIPEQINDVEAQPSSINGVSNLASGEGHHTKSSTTYQVFTIMKLLLSGYLGAGRIAASSTNLEPNRNASDIRDLLDISTNTKVGSIYFDEDLSSVRDNIITFIVIGLSTRFIGTYAGDYTSPFMYVSLALAPTARLGEYRKIGVVLEASQMSTHEYQKRIPDNILWAGKGWATITLV
ncbi:hypothetical protein FB567DRAFT_625488 [Paraphoma chrysanthemicola]|uniref:Heterokaryon incompatibility domain-containing protein n=1 Tax=Paraphoma chrysanthemicola TaxID=798071 RepID=A0A8K0REU0_9PLEO|nr:hypothetical protein FB567DRAFT_625488 [Paraphoma chrysanthemicola]